MDDVNLRGCVEVTIFNAKGEFLAVTSRKFKGICGVGGKVEPGEHFRQAAIRELLEETNVTAVTMDFVAGTTLAPIKGDDAKVNWYCAGFIATIGDEEPEEIEPGTKPFWCDPARLMTDECIIPDYYKWWFGLLRQLGKMPLPVIDTKIKSDAMRALEEARRPFVRKVVGPCKNGYAVGECGHMLPVVDGTVREASCYKCERGRPADIE